MGFNRNDQIFLGLEHYIKNHLEKKVPPGQAYIDWQVLYHGARDGACADSIPRRAS
ncbi:hypothetical protein AZE42_03359 [Rhizopogon vesiculosus]|uniref:Uncharacterized protein n=1 Tax=Rhizopogon vesiculosus TaxID=180088 RepID=A0A1J8Q9Z7_9AGAM|nr:hypothetical protein AZE42_03359 [Rhizopogon vesiculosus]